MDSIMDGKHALDKKRQYKSLNGLMANPDTLCGCGSCKPSWIQTLANPKMFTLNAALVLLAKVSVFTYFGGVLATLERRFQLSSVESGGLTIINDVAELSIAVFVSYFGHTGHRPRWVATGSIVIGIGILLSAMPHFVSDALDPDAVISGSFGSVGYGDDNNNISICLPHSERTQNRTLSSHLLTVNGSLTEKCDEKTGGFGPVKWLIVGQVLAGLGTTPLYPLLISYLDDSVGKLQLTSYTAILFVAMAVGAAGGYVLSSQVTTLYVDFDRIPADEIPDIPQYDPRWIGAWWLGFVVTGIFIIILSIPMFFYPRRMPSPQPVHMAFDATVEMEKRGEEKAIELDTKDVEHIGGVLRRAGGISGILKALQRLLTNVPFMFMCLSASAETATFAIMGAFGIKTVQLQFTISPSLAAGVMGGMLIPVNIVSQLVSAYICRKFKLGMRGCARMILLFLTIGGVIYPLLMFVGCDNFKLAGINAEYSSTPMSGSPETESFKQASNLNNSCNFDCACSEEIFRPVCGSDGITYISPCHAGCTGSNTTIETGQSLNKFQSKREEIVYDNCKCIGNETFSDVPPGSAVSGLCLDCGIVIFLISVCLYAPLLFALYVTANPIIYLTMRVVDEEDRSVALAFKSVLTKCIGYFPSPVLFGVIINSTCIYWQRSCSNQGACWIYDIVNYRYAYFGAVSVLRLISIICYIVVNFFIKPEPNELENLQSVENEESEERKELHTVCDENVFKGSDNMKV